MVSTRALRRPASRERAVRLVRCALAEHGRSLVECGGNRSAEMGGCRQRLHRQRQVGIVSSIVPRACSERASVREMIGHLAEGRAAIDLVDDRAGQAGAAADPTCDASSSDA